MIGLKQSSPVTTSLVLSWFLFILDFLFFAVLDKKHMRVTAIFIKKIIEIFCEKLVKKYNLLVEKFEINRQSLVK